MRTILTALTLLALAASVQAQGYSYDAQALAALNGAASRYANPPATPRDPSKPLVRVKEEFDWSFAAAKRGCECGTGAPCTCPTGGCSCGATCGCTDGRCQGAAKKAEPVRTYSTPVYYSSPVYYAPPVTYSAPRVSYSAPSYYGGYSGGYSMPSFGGGGFGGGTCVGGT